MDMCGEGVEVFYGDGMFWNWGGVVVYCGMVLGVCGEFLVFFGGVLMIWN